uniref:Uncharacterized protein n=1 Tax=Rhipicephalus appendiculatus TaxID=34631 RepID=A0A131YCA8_RHIAP
MKEAFRELSGKRMFEERKCFTFEGNALQIHAACFYAVFTIARSPLIQSTCTCLRPFCCPDICDYACTFFRCTKIVLPLNASHSFVEEA